MKLVIFDVDGTLVDSQAMIVACLTSAFEMSDLTRPSRDEMLSIVGLSLPEAMSRLAPQQTHDQVLKMADDYRSAFVAHRKEFGHDGAPLYTGAAEAVEALAARPDVVVAVATGKSRRGLNALAEAWPFAQHFVSMQCADDHPSKPNPSMVFACLADANVEAGDTIVVFCGDTMTRLH